MCSPSWFPHTWQASDVPMMECRSNSVSLRASGYKVHAARGWEPDTPMAESSVSGKVTLKFAAARISAGSGWGRFQAWEACSSVFPCDCITSLASGEGLLGIVETETEGTVDSSEKALPRFSRRFHWTLHVAALFQYPGLENLSLVVHRLHALPPPPKIPGWDRVGCSTNGRLYGNCCQLCQ